MGGSRPGALVSFWRQKIFFLTAAQSVGAWASLVTVGEDGFVAMATKIGGHRVRACFLNNRSRFFPAAESLTAIKKAVANGQCGAIRLVGNPLAMVLAFDSDEFDIQRWFVGRP